MWSVIVLCFVARYFMFILHVVLRHLDGEESELLSLKNNIYFQTMKEREKISNVIDWVLLALALWA